MKKLSVMIAATALAFGAWAMPSFVQFSSVGPDLYADGTTVLDGEIYALVSVAGTEFGGINADGSLVNPKDKIVCMAPLAEGGHCKNVVFTLPEGVTTSKLAVYLFDTRVKSSADAKVKVAGLKADGSLAVVNSYTAVENTKGAAVANVKSVASDDAVVAALPANVPQPVVTGIKVVGAQVLITVGNTVPYVQYTVTGGATPSNLDQNNLVEGINGASEDITLIVDEGAAQDCRFFKVTRATK